MMATTIISSISVKPACLSESLCSTKKEIGSCIVYHLFHGLIRTQDLTPFSSLNHEATAPGAD